ncbi:biotin carboxylase N-terminal domain-containing protein [Pseudonocardia endophytica]|uniref:Propionyl-CoA carboxylase alpha chain/3-methylcrotonyl-CoA carboxylase alpha subunit n=1 Tax=Pseudonocardia endophytica TaxID=401976 RepID=A0A4V2PHV5_PSEEN|nr:biotin carboxylase N-terminal domain-containing protein [Pseudonocardia endophytica]TCK22256.1 propionyl-CoA carboxylase alpha chain/3-methylcrotonyl-CoA carboxylase alpha subunit [Pseudonocardia endophytica]
MIRTLLVANRGEIARRVFRTARAMGIRTVAVYSEPDAGAPHVRDADLAVALGGRTSAESYLDVDGILAAAAATGADAVHPGYGFLSENAGFAVACGDAGLVFVGPAPESIADMGLKDRAKALARKAGVPVLPDAPLVGDDAGGWRAAAAEVGYPLLVKAVAGGGGRGMRLVGHPDDLAGAVAAARREAQASFGDPDVFCERYLRVARHVEIQVFADAHGRALHLGERECSIQRRHQKVLEEAPSPAVSPDLRRAMGDTAVALAREIGYLGAGTVEYLLDDTTGEFFFLEMNTRLQVEHPVTEEVTGLDLVRLQLEVAQGMPLRIGKDDVTIRGHAIEVRLYAEDPARGYLPTPGPLHRYAHPHDLPGVRFEDGVAAPGEITPFYDPMLAKIVAVADDRAEAAARLAGALDATEVHGTTTNRAHLAAVLRDPDFLAGGTRTDYLDAHPGLATPSPPDLHLVHLSAVVATAAAARRADDRRTPFAAPGFRLLPGSPLTRSIWEGPAGGTHEVEYRLDDARGDTSLVLAIADGRHEVHLRDLGPDAVRVECSGVEHRCAVHRYPDGSHWVTSALGQTGWRPAPRLPEPDPVAATGGPTAELPGTVVAVLVVPGDRVEPGQPLVVVEAMKMEHPAVAAGPGVVRAVLVEVGQYVPARSVLVELAPDVDAQS